MPGGRPPATPPPDPRLAKHIERQGTALSTSSCDADDLDVVLVAGNGPVDFEVQDRRPPQRSHTTQQKTCTFRLADFDSDPPIFILRELQFARIFPFREG